ncbi:MAG: aminotransferase class I/II-fold pyridoxal phosphate-dependent enzyme [Patescibacteria group bacterium]
MNSFSTARRILSFPEYPFAKIMKMKREIEREKRKPVLDLTIGTPTFPPSKEYVKKLNEYFLMDDAHLYPGFGAIPELEHALITWYGKRFAVTLEKEEIYPLLGGKDGIAHIPLAILDEGDELLVPNPGYPGFIGSTLMIGAIPVDYSVIGLTSSIISSIKKKTTAKTKAIWINSPGNPTGLTFSDDELKKLVDFALLRNIILLYDNAYSEITFDNYIAPSILKFAGAKDIAIEIGSLSKTASFAGFRIGWIVGNKKVISAVAKVKSQMDSGLTLPFQKLAAHTLNNFNDTWYKDMLIHYQNNRDILARAFTSLGLDVVKPKGALYLWIRIPDSYKDANEYVTYLLQTYHVLVTPGTAFGAEGERYIRVSISSDISKIKLYFKNI